MSNNSQCPICSTSVAPGEKLLSYYYEPRDWWVVVHTGPDDTDMTLLDSTIVIPKARAICHQARYEQPVLIGQRSAR